MHALRHLSPLHRGLTIAFLACALLVRLLVPAGWMPVADPSGSRLALCDGTTMAMPAAMAGMVHDDAGKLPMHHQGATDHPCAFAVPAATPDTPVLAIPLPYARVAVAPGLVRTLVAIGRGLAAPPPPQTGPPAFA